LSSSTLLPLHVPGRQRLAEQRLEPPGPGAGLDGPLPAGLQRVAAHGDAPLGAPPAVAELSWLPAAQDLPVDAVQHRVVPLELPGERPAAEHHPAEVTGGEVEGVLLGRVVPLDVVQVMVDGGVAEPARVAGHRLEVELWRGDHVGVVEQQRPGEVVLPPQDHVLRERARQHRPRRACVQIISLEKPVIKLARRKIRFLFRRFVQRLYVLFSPRTSTAQYSVLYENSY
jgi:hypothetical protein